MKTLFGISGRNILFAVSAAVAFVLAGCNHADVNTTYTSSSAPGLGIGRKPPTVYVAAFSTNATQVQVDPGGPLKRLADGQPLRQGGLLSRLFGSPQEQAQNMVQTSNEQTAVGIQSASTLQGDLVQALTNVGIPAAYAANYQDNMPNAVLLTGQFVSIDEGSKTKRMVIGLGAGASYLETQAQLRDLSHPENVPVLSFHTSRDSGMAPGALVGAGIGEAVTGAAAVGAGVSGVRQSRTGTSADISDTANQIAAYLKTYYQQHGWLPQDPPTPTAQPASQR